MSVWTALSAFSDKMEERRKQKEFDNSARGRTLTKEFFVNHMDAFGNEVSKLVEHFGAITTQRTDTTLNKHTNDIVTAFKQLWEDRTEELIKYFNVGVGKAQTSFTELLDGFFSAHNNAAELRHQEADKRAIKRNNVIMKYILGMFGHIQSAELNNADRYLQLQERHRESDMLAEKYHNTTFNTMICLYEHTVDHIVQLKDRFTAVEGKLAAMEKQRIHEYPSLEWVLLNEEDLRRVCHALACIRDNVTPFENAAKQASDGLKALGDFTTEAIEEALRAKQLEYGNAA